MPFYSPSTNGFYDGGSIPGDAIEITKEERTALLDAQYRGKLLQVVDGKVVAADPVGPSLDDLKAEKSEKITASCLAAIDSGFDYGGHRYDSDLVSRTNIIGTATGVQAGIPVPAGFTWRTSDNENVPLDGPGVIALGAALLQHVNQQYALSWQLKAQIEAATTAEEVAAISWPPGGSPTQP
ncbi:hypothetical protein CAL14_05625 [Bordetella genomosp. 9]|uniref:DUF4376 domain-containing protein n=1 Tax=Bordetella genomosp. 9 TaxID=1416803 RepID=UPI000A296478|nr:DUF4376 domain-containing protein [Bordetella genomosp. 9]ARP89832.1 hypothetical protein CAL14_05625 [Bordetella genomosp. 9]